MAVYLEKLYSENNVVNHNFTTDNAIKIINDFGIYDLLPDQIVDHEIIKTIDAIEYDFCSEELGGNSLLELIS